MPALWEIAASLRLPVFPCTSPSKRPTCAHGFKDAQTDRQKIRELFLRFGGDLIGVPTGGISGINVLDLDSSKHPTEVREWLQSHRSLIPPTRAHQTKSGGVHYVFSDLVGMSCHTGNPLPGIDIRAAGGYVIWWPALGFATNSKPILPWPKDLAAPYLAKQKPSKPKPIPKISEPRLEAIVRRVALSANGTRNDVLFWGACRCGEWIQAGELARSTAEGALLAAATHSGLPLMESLRTIASGINRTP